MNWDTVPDGDRRVCVACGTPARSYQYRFHPPESFLFERCIGLAWCSACRIYTTNLVYVPRKRVLADSLAALPAEQQERLLRSETRLVDFLDRRARGGGGGSTAAAPRREGGIR
ncbi:hypothetical protein ACIGFK_37305 [Streptomyces sp. NPDC085524]|uniref:hypothetical protein n=1 Tax=Streptomyces sp. NPDC085524 TaxID=3365728 RepID=UPI0037D05255